VDAELQPHAVERILTVEDDTLVAYACIAGGTVDTLTTNCQDLQNTDDPIGSADGEQFP
jgi:hypothetical protein